MNISEEEWAARLRLSKAQANWMKFVAEHPEATDIASFAGFQERIKGYGYPIQNWPTFVNKQLAAQMEACAVGLDRLLKDVFVRYFDYDAEKIAEFHGGEAETIELLLSEPDGLDAAMTRSDTILTSEGFKCVEINVGGSLGGLNLCYMAPFYLEQPLIKEFIRQQGLRVSYPDTIDIQLNHMIEEVDAAEGLGDEINLAIMVCPPDPNMVQTLHDWYYLEGFKRLIESYDPPLKGSFRFFDRFQYEIKNGEVYVGGKRIHAVAEQQHDQATPNDLFRAFKAGKLQLFSGPQATMLGDKRYLALLSSLVETNMLTADECALVHRHLPWARMIRRGKVRFEGAESNFEELLLRNRENFVIKPVDECSGKGVLVGRYTTTAEWEQAVGQALGENNWLVQSYLSSLPISYLNPKRGVVPHEMVWGLFAIGGQYGGGYLRSMPKGGFGVINAAQGACESIVLEVEE